MKKIISRNTQNFILRIFAKELLISSIFAFGIAFTPVIAHAQIFNPNSKNQACQGVGDPTTSNGCIANPEAKANSTLGDFVNIFSVIIGILTVIMVMMAGFKYITSNGDANRVNSAKETLTWSLIGVVIVALSQVLVHFVLYRATTAAGGG
jgi:cytochrome bd-type quinol oxidase subunit 2